MRTSTNFAAANVLPLLSLLMITTLYCLSPQCQAFSFLFSWGGAGARGGAAMRRKEGESVRISGTEFQLGGMTNGQDKTGLKSSKDHSCAIWEDSRLV